MKQTLLISTLFALFIVLFSTNAFAQAGDTGVDFRIAIGAPISQQNNIEYYPSQRTSHLWNYWMTGGAGIVSIGYRWANVGIYFDQEMIYTVDPFRKKGERSGTDGLHGGTYFVVRAILPFRKVIQLDVGAGAGMMYDMDNNHIIYNVNKNSGYRTNVLAFALKTTFGFTYYLKSFFGLGFTLDYSLGIHRNSYPDYPEPRVIYPNAIARNTLLVHNFNPLFVIRFKI